MSPERITDAGGHADLTLQIFYTTGDFASVLHLSEQARKSGAIKRAVRIVQVATAAPGTLVRFLPFDYGLRGFNEYYFDHAKKPCFDYHLFAGPSDFLMVYGGRRPGAYGSGDLSLIVEDESAVAAYRKRYFTEGFYPPIDALAHFGIPGELTTACMDIPEFVRRLFGEFFQAYDAITDPSIFSERSEDRT